VTEWVFLGFYSFQQLPIFVLVLMVAFCACQNVISEGPSTKARVMLVIAAFLMVSNDLPLDYWAQLLPGMFFPEP
jgi:hypothetical protein